MDDVQKVQKSPDKLAAALLATMMTGVPLDASLFGATVKVREPKVNRQPNVVQWLEPELLADDVASLILNVARLVRIPSEHVMVKSPKLAGAPVLTAYVPVSIPTRCPSAHKFRPVCGSILTDSVTCSVRKDHDSQGPLARQKSRAALLVTAPYITPSRRSVPSYTVPFNLPTVEKFAPSARLTTRQILTSKIDFNDAGDARCYAHRVDGQLWCAECM